MGAVNNRTVAAIRALFTIMDTPQFIQSGATRAPGLLTSERRPRPKRPEPFGEGRRLAVQVAHKLGNPKSCNAESNCEKSQTAPEVETVAILDIGDRSTCDLPDIYLRPTAMNRAQKNRG
jgi:hypothetical protein